MTNQTIEAVANDAVKTAVRAARGWLDRNDAKIDDYGAFTECLRANLKIRMAEGLRDGKAAMDAGSSAAAVATFNASVCLAGIDAAKEASVPANPPRPEVVGYAIPYEVFMAEARRQEAARAATA